MLIKELLLGLSGAAGLYAKNVSVITFRDKEKAVELEEFQLDKLQQFYEIGICFRIVMEVMKAVIILNTPYFYLYLKNNDKFMGGIDLKNSTNGYIMYGPLFSLCQPYIPGEWVFLCFNMKFTRDTFQMTGVQNGHLCFQEEIEAHFEFHLKEKLTLPDM